MIEPPLPPARICGTPAFTAFHTPLEVDVDHRGPVGFAGLVQRLSAVADARVGDDDVELAELLDAGVHGFLEGVVVTDVDLGGVDPTVVSLHQVRGLGQILRRGGGDQIHGVDLLADVDRDDVGTLLGQSHRVRTALTARRAGDERDLAFDSTRHRYLVSLVVIAQPMTAGIVSHPRTVDVGDNAARLRSTCHSGNRFKISSSAIRPSSRASAEPRQ